MSRLPDIMPSCFLPFMWFLSFRCFHASRYLFSCWWFFPFPSFLEAPLPLVIPTLLVFLSFCRTNSTGGLFPSGASIPSVCPKRERATRMEVTNRWNGGTNSEETTFWRSFPFWLSLPFWCLLSFWVFLPTLRSFPLVPPCFLFIPYSLPLVGSRLVSLTIRWRLVSSCVILMVPFLLNVSFPSRGSSFQAITFLQVVPFLLVPPFTLLISHFQFVPYL